MLAIRRNLQGNQALRRAAGRSRGAQKQAAVSASGAVADDFLKQTFYPVTPAVLPHVGSIIEMERSFFTSLSNLATLYVLDTTTTSEMVFPQNIWSAYTHAKSQLETKRSDLQLFITEVDSLPVVCTAKVMDTGSTLHYIPLYPLHVMLQHKNKKQLAQLLLSAFAVLHRAGVPLCDTSSFMGYQMEMVAEWAQETPEEWEEKEYLEVNEQMEATMGNCSRLSEMVRKRAHTARFDRHVKKIRVDNDKEHAVVKAIEQVFVLSDQYPQRQFGEQIRDRFILPDSEDRISMDQYLSFFWGEETWFEQQVSENINAHLNEMEIVDEPVSLQLFDKPQTREHHDLEFETALLTCISNLNTALYGC